MTFVKIIITRAADGTYQLVGEPEDWADVRTAALGEGAEVDQGAPLTGWEPYTRVYHITYPMNDPATHWIATYFVAE